MRRLAFVLGLLIVCGTSRAAEAQLLGPFLDEEAAAVVRLNLSGLDVPKTMTRLLGPFSIYGEIPTQCAAIQNWADSLRKAGAAELFLIVGPSNFPSPPSIVVPLPAGVPAKRIGEVLCGGGAEKPLYAWPTCVAVHGAVFAGTDEALERVVRNNPAVPVRSEIVEALQAERRGTIQVILTPAADQRRILEEMIPTLPKELGGGPITTLSRGMKWSSLAVELEPKAALHLMIQATNRDSGEALRKLADGLLKFAAQRSAPNPVAVSALGRVEVKLIDDRLSADLDVDQLAKAIQPTLDAMREEAARGQCTNNLKQIMLAMHNFIDVDKSRAFPPAYRADQSGKPLLSWRVLILPYLEQADLYKEFHLDEPWDSPHNKALISRMPEVYRCPALNGENAGRFKTTYLAPRGKTTMFPGAVGLKLKEITDGTSNTIAVVDAGDDRAVVWTAPDDWEVEAALKPAAVLNHHPNGSKTGFADGSVRFLKSNIKPETLGKLLTPRGGEAVGPEDD